MIWVPFPTALGTPFPGQDQESEEAQEKGPLVYLDLKEAAVGSVFRMLGRKHGLSVVVSPEVTGSVSAHFDGDPLQSALESLATASGVDLRRQGDILEVLPGGSLESLVPSVRSDSG